MHPSTTAISEKAKASSSAAASDGPGLVAALEGNQLSLWDCRAAEDGGCVRRVQPGAGGLYGMDCGEGVVAVAGKDRCVHLVRHT